MSVLLNGGAQFEQVAELLTDRVKDLLGAPIHVLDDRGVVVASSNPDLVRLPLDPHQREEDGQCLSFSLQLNGRSGEVVVCQPSNGEVLSPRLTQALIELVINQTTLVDRLPNQSELKNKFIYDLLHGHINDEEAILRHARFLGMDLTPPRAVLLIDASQYILSSADSHSSEFDDSRIQRHAQTIINSIVSFFHLPSDTICAYIGDGEIAVLKASNTKNLAGWADTDETPQDTNASWANLAALKRAGDALLARLRSDTGTSVNVGIGRYHPGIDGLANSYKDARIGLSLGRHLHGQNRVHCLDGLGVAAFVGVSDEQTKIDLATHLLSPLNYQPEMLNTLEAFFENDCSPSATAKKLSIHRNTLTYRLDKIASLTGLDPRRFDDAVQIRLSLLLRSLATTAVHPELTR